MWPVTFHNVSLSVSHSLYCVAFCMLFRMLHNSGYACSGYTFLVTWEMNRAHGTKGHSISLRVNKHDMLCQLCSLIRLWKLVINAAYLLLC
jgi:hypothetical protein